MNINRIFNKLFGKSDNEKEVTNEEIEALANVIRKQRKEMTEWKEMFGIICFNVWHRTNQDFKRSGDLVDLEIPFLCAFGIFQEWQTTWLARKYDIEMLLSQIPEFASQECNKIIGQLSIVKAAICQFTEKSHIEAVKPFISIFTEVFINSYKQQHDTVNAMDVFQCGVETLFLFEMRLNEVDRQFYHELLDKGEYQEDIDDIIVQMNNAQLKR